MRCGLGSIPLYSLKILPLFLQSTTFRSLVKPNGSNIMLRQHLGCRPFWLARRCHLQTFELPKGIRSHKWPVGTMAISISCSQPSLSVHNFGEKGPPCPPNFWRFTKFNEKKVGGSELRRGKEIQDPERKQKEWSVKEQEGDKKRLRRQRFLSIK